MPFKYEGIGQIKNAYMFILGGLCSNQFYEILEEELKEYIIKRGTRYHILKKMAV